ncbi:hypothetical protein BCR35DRAFT_313259 [Leucosporidium creatinivorum]|uniref:PHD-type domain-containing protein n=1 Tax=Leucosporidium creatinivorum TaxID=106004 RepID=A0A1Y2FRR6_9BASI|nr:hypothetical protein BCR35DRAFT_313259 [Leucosporidium creatinivorum]
MALPPLEKMERSPELERLAERAYFSSSRVPEADFDSLTNRHFSILLLPTRPPLIAWSDLEPALAACFGSPLAVDMEQIKGGELGLQLVVLAIERVDPRSLGRGAEEKLEDWISALKLAAGEQARRHPWHSRESAPELDDEEKVQLEEIRERAQPMATPAPSVGGSLPSPSVERADFDEEKVQTEQLDVDQERTPAPSVASSSRSSSPEPDAAVELASSTESRILMPTSRSPSIASSRVTSPVISSERSSSPSPPLVARKKSALVLRQRSPSTSSSSASEQARKSVERAPSSTPPFSTISAPTFSLPSSTSGWIQLISRAIETLPIATGSIYEIMTAIKSLHPSVKLEKKVQRKVSKVLAEYMCFECDEGLVCEKSYHDRELTMWSLHEKWRDSALKGDAIKWTAAWAEDDGEELWCICRKPYGGRDMLVCADSRCKIQWFHDDCVGEPEEMWDPSIKWRCPDCSSSASTRKGEAREATSRVSDEQSRKRGRDGKFVRRA